MGKDKAYSVKFYNGRIVVITEPGNSLDMTVMDIVLLLLN